MAGRKRRKKNALYLKPETLHSLVAAGFFGLGGLMLLSFTNQGSFLTALNGLLLDQLGFAALVTPFICLAAGLSLINTKWPWTKPPVLLGSVLILTGVVLAFRQGALGMSIAISLSSLVSSWGTSLVGFLVSVIGLFIMLQISWADVLEFLHRLQPDPTFDLEEDIDVSVSSKTSTGWTLPKLSLGKKGAAKFEVNDNVSVNLEATEQADGLATTEHKTPPDSTDSVQSQDIAKIDLGMTAQAQSENLIPRTSDLGVWEYPPLSLLSKSTGGKADRGDVKSNADMIEQTLDSFNIAAKIKEVNYGPSVTQYALEISRGTKLSKITNLSTDLALALAAPTGQVRIEAPIPGKSLVGIEVPNYSAQYVTLRAMLSSSVMKKHTSKLAVALGIDVAGNFNVVDIAKMPHVLVAGATGSGKSVAINAFLSSLLFRNSPEELNLILVDPKRVELTGYNDIPHLLTPVIVEPNKVVSALKWACAEMENRYKKLASAGVKNIDGFNELSGFMAMPNIVIVIDELADIMLFAPSEVEDAVTRLAQMARAVGIHLVLATQRPSVDVITGLIKANIPTRIAFSVSSMADSRVILDQPGAEKLLGKGDMLYIPPTQAKPSRIQGTFVSDGETRQLIEFIKAQGHKPEYEDEIINKFQASVVKGGSSIAIGNDTDDLFNDAVKLIAQYDKASSSMLQRRLSVGYARAARILDQLYEAGLVSPPEGSKPREVISSKVAEYMAGGG